MAALVFPVSSTPGSLPGEGEGRLLNAYADKLGEKLLWRRVPGLTPFAETGLQTPRGWMDLAGTVIAAFVDQAVKILSNGTVLGFGPIPGTDFVTWAHNNRTTGGVATPDIVAVRSSGGPYVFLNGGMVPYLDTDLPTTVNSVSFLGGYLLFTNPDGRIFATGLNTTDVDALSFATAESSADRLVRGIVWGGLFFAMGSESIEPWLNQGLTPFPLQRATSTIPIGLLSASAVAGHEEGWGFSPYFVASDLTVRELQGYETRVVSTPAVEAFIADSDAATLEACVYTFRGRAHWVLSSNLGTWVYDVVRGAWHERISTALVNWRGSRSVKSNGRWIIGDRRSGSVFRLDDKGGWEASDPIVWTVESAPLKEFPARGVAPSLLLDFTPVANAAVDISWSHDGGGSWLTDGESRPLKPDGAGPHPVRQNRLGEFSHHGLRVRLVVDDPVAFSFMGASVPSLDPRAS